MPEAKETYRKSFLSTMLRLEAFLKQTKRSNMTLDQVSIELCYAFLNSRPQTASSFNRERKHLSSLLGAVLRPLAFKSSKEHSH